MSLCHIHVGALLGWWRKAKIIPSFLEGVARCNTLLWAALHIQAANQGLYTSISLQKGDSYTVQYHGIYNRA